jgi:hypothetical protein
MPFWPISGLMEAQPKNAEHPLEECPVPGPLGPGRLMFHCLSFLRCCCTLRNCNGMIGPPPGQEPAVLPVVMTWPRRQHGWATPVAVPTGLVSSPSCRLSPRTLRHKARGPWLLPAGPAPATGRESGGLAVHYSLSPFPFVVWGCSCSRHTVRRHGWPNQEDSRAHIHLTLDGCLGVSWLTSECVSGHVVEDVRREGA